MTMLARFHHAARADSGLNPGPRPGRGAPLARAALRCAVRFIRDNLDAKLTWENVAAAIDLDPFTFGRAFKLATGLTPHAYIVRCRLRRARRLLAAAELSIAEVALEVGCSCQSHLTTMFRTHVGTTPAAFRRAAAQAQQPLSGEVSA